MLETPLICPQIRAGPSFGGVRPGVPLLLQRAHVRDRRESHVLRGPPRSLRTGIPREPLPERGRERSGARKEKGAKERRGTQSWENVALLSVSFRCSHMVQSSIDRSHSGGQITNPQRVHSAGTLCGHTVCSSMPPFGVGGGYRPPTVGKPQRRQESTRNSSVSFGCRLCVHALSTYAGEKLCLRRGESAGCVRCFCEPRSPSRPSLGCCSSCSSGGQCCFPFRPQEKPLLNSGAAGFVLSRASLSLLAQAWKGGGGLPEEVPIALA